MPGGSDRRAVLRLAMTAALAPALARRGLAAETATSGRFEPPGMPMIFTRHLERPLRDGNKVTVGRSFAVRFTRAPVGWSVTGEQVEVVVDFPPSLSQFAALERQRKETGLFPLQLDADGQIVDGPEPRPAKELDAAVALVMSRLGKTAAAANDPETLAAFVRAVHEAGTQMTSLLPVDLFAPRERERQTRRDLPLPGGGQGTIELSFTAESDPDTGLMRRARREIVTQIANDRRLTREDWTLAPA
jgi:hypothetical protein